MDEYIGLDVSMKETAVSIRRDGKRVWRGTCASDLKLIAHLIQNAHRLQNEWSSRPAPYPCGSITHSAQRGCR